MYLANITSLLVEATIVVGVLLLLFHRRYDWGLTPLAVALGVFQHMQVVLAASVYVPVGPSLQVSPGSVVLFPAILFSVLLIYIYEDAIEARKLIYGLLLANVTVAGMSYAASRHVSAADTINVFALPPEFFSADWRIMAVGTVCLFLDAILVIVVYESTWARRLHPCVRVFLTITGVLCLDHLLFTLGAFFEDVTFQQKLSSGLFGKCGAGVFYSAFLYAYLRFQADRPTEPSQSRSWDLFKILSYREKYDQLGAEAQALETRVQQRTAELREANHHLQKLSQQLLSAQEAERRSLVRAMHDEIGQLLTLVQVRIRSAEPGATVDALGHLHAAGETVGDTIKQIRNLSLQLRPPVLDELGLGPALEWLTEQLTRQTGTPIHLSCGLDTNRVSHQQRSVLYRVAQEAMTNAMRHAMATEINLELNSNGGSITLRIEDNGCGFNVEPQPADQTGLGLVGLQQRVELIGGELAVESTLGEGTRLTVTCAIAPTTQRRDSE